MKIYQQEINDGIAEVINQASVACFAGFVNLKPEDNDVIKSLWLLIKAILTSLTFTI